VSKFNRVQTHNQKIVGLLDIGSSKIVCLIVALDGLSGETGRSGPRIIGIGHCWSKGIKAGVITDLDRAEEAVRACISQAEIMAGVTLEDVVVSVNCGRLKSRNFSASAEIEDGIVRDADVARIFNDARLFVERNGRSLVHMNHVGYRLDGCASGRDPRGMAARVLTADLHAVSADEAPVRNLLMLIERCYLNVSGLVIAPYASGLGALSEDERRLGATCIDIGGGTTSFAVFIDGNMIFNDAIAVGSDHITYDIARQMQTPLAEAERIKALYGTLVHARSDEHDVFSYPLADEEEGVCGQATMAQLAQIIRPRVSSLLSLLNERFGRSGLSGQAVERFVITGGGSQLVGMGEFAADALGSPVRIGRPVGASSGVLELPQNVSSPAFSTVVGMLGACIDAGGELVTYKDREVLFQGYLGRVGQWLKESL